jgi:hypothetical protein
MRTTTRDVLTLADQLGARVLVWRPDRTTRYLITFPDSEYPYSVTAFGPRAALAVLRGVMLERERVRTHAVRQERMRLLGGTGS